MNKKRVLSGVLAMLLALITFSGLGGCSKEQKPLRILIDMVLTEDDAASYKIAADMLLDGIKRSGGPEDIEYEIVPAAGSEREAMLTRIRTEIMAGQGPDVFLMGYHGGLGTDGKPKVGSLFLMPEKSMELGLFMPLDKYIEKAQFMEWDALVPTIMEAGRTEKGQMIIPFDYTYCNTFYLKSDVPEISESLTWDDMVNSDSAVLQFSAAYVAFHRLPFLYSFGQIADFKEKQLQFSEEELLRRVNECLELDITAQNGELTDLPSHFQWPLMADFEFQNYWCERYAESDGSTNYIPSLVEAENEITQKELTMVPVYNDDGGVTATIYHFGAVNANCRRPEDAFFVLDYLMGRSNQQGGSDIFLVSERNMLTIPVYADMMSEACPILPNATMMTSLWHMNDANFAEFVRVRDQINQVNFFGTMEWELDQLYYDCLAVKNGNSTKSIEDLVHERYTRMKRQLSE